MPAERVDLVVIGGGIAGLALALATVREGVDVVVLEREGQYRDRVRGETLLPWGVAEALRLGLEPVLLEAGGGYVTQLVPYDETTEPAVAEANPIALSAVLPGVPGAFDVGHPEACAALAEAATAAGARLRRGVGDVQVRAGNRPTVAYQQDSDGHEVECRLVVGADGRGSAVRRQIGLSLQETKPRILGGGLLVSDVEGWPEDKEFIGTEDDVLFYCFPRPGGLARLYLFHDLADRGKYGGPGRPAEFLAAFRRRCLPPGDAIAAATVAGPCAFYPMNDSWMDWPGVEGCVLIGDAAGWSDPILGQGLSVALRDARIVADALLDSDDWSCGAFASYASERQERMRRLRVAARIATLLRCTFTPEGRRRRAAWRTGLAEDPMLRGFLTAVQAGPERAPHETVSEDAIAYIDALVNENH